MNRWFTSLLLLSFAAAPLRAAEPPACVPWRPQYLCLCPEYCCKPLPPVDCGVCTTEACYDRKSLPCWGLNVRYCDDCYQPKPEPCRLPTPLCPGFGKEAKPNPFVLRR